MTRADRRATWAWEEPVSAWKDMPGSKLWPGQFAVVGSDLWKLARHYKRPA